MEHEISIKLTTDQYNQLVKYFETQKFSEYEVIDLERKVFKKPGEKNFLRYSSEKTPSKISQFLVMKTDTAGAVDIVKNSIEINLALQENSRLSDVEIFCNELGFLEYSSYTKHRLHYVFEDYIIDLDAFGTGEYVLEIESEKINIEELSKTLLGLVSN
jgi:adenylate cyclase class IV